MTLAGDGCELNIGKLTEIISQQSRVPVLDRHGYIRTLPHDSQTQLAHYIAVDDHRVSNLKRYCIGQMFSTTSVISPPQKPTTELALDIVTPSPSRQADAEVIITFSRILQDCQLLPVVLQASHHLLIKAVLVYCGVPEDQQSKACHQLRKKITQHREGRNSIDLSFDFNRPQEQLLTLMSASGELRGVKSYFNGLTDWDGNVASQADQAFNELNEIISQAEEMGLQCPVFISMNTCLERYDSYSGFVFRFACQNLKFT